MEAIDTRIGSGRITVCLGASYVPIPATHPSSLIRISCDVPRETYGPLLALVERVSFVLGEDDGASHPLLQQARTQVFEFARRVLGDVPHARGALSQVVTAANRLAKSRAVIVLDAVDAADDATLEALKQIATRRDWLKVPLVLGLRTLAPSGLAAELVATVEKTEGASAIFRAAPRPRREPVATSVLPPETRHVLRAASLLGPAFELPLVAAIVERSPLEVLEHLQLAADLGVSIEDRGGGTFALDEQQVVLLKEGLLPSLRAFLHASAARLLSPRAESAAPHDTARIASESAPGDATAPAELRREGPEATAKESAVVDRTSDVDREVSAPLDPPAPITPASPSRPSAVEAPAEPRVRPTDDRFEPRRPRGFDVGPGRGLEDHARARGHFDEAGDAPRAIEQTILGAAKASRLGAHAQAEALLGEALAAARALPLSDAHRELEILALLELGRIRLEGFAPVPKFDLAGALEPLEEAKKLLTKDEPPDLHVRLAQLSAAAFCERGDGPSLELALATLVDASRALLAAGHARHATRLLNDQAAVYLQMGDPVRAMSLLERSRQTFEGDGARDAVALHEIAETDHLIARIPLHVPARPGREDDALSRALDHALAALRGFTREGAHHAAARVEETMGRLELKRGRVKEAIEHLQRALQAQEQLSDLVGLARTTAALSEALLGAGRVEQALGLLADSLALNHRKGSIVGVAYNRRAFAAISPKLSANPLARELVAELGERLDEAEAELGAIHLPGEGDPR